MWSDNDTRLDYLNFRCVAETAAELIVQANGAPLSMGVSGGWGVGKSSMLNLISDALAARVDSENYLFINFNAWLYQGYDDARAALLEDIAIKLAKHAEHNASALAKVNDLMSRVDWLRVAGLTLGSVLAVTHGLPPVGLLGAGWAALQGATDGDVTEEDAIAVEKAGKDVAAAGVGIIKPKKKPSPQKQIAAIRKQFAETLQETNTTLVVFIDDLDRCLPSTAISTLEAMRLFLFLPRTAFVIAADDKMIRQAVRTHFKDVELDNELVTSYFDKLIQVPLRVPPLGTQEVRAYLMLLYVDKSGLDDKRKEEVRTKVCERLSQSWTGKRVDLKFVTGLLPDAPSELNANLELADRLAPLMTTAPQIAGNPRLIKRFLNTLSIRLAVAESQNVSVDESTLAKVLLFERCASESAYQRLVTAVNNGNDGRPEFLSVWEKQARAGDNVVGLDRDWNTPFINSWLALEPALGETDLRAVVYVSRETLPIVTAADQMSTAAQDILEGLMQLTAETSTFREQLAALPGSDLNLLASRLLVRARGEQTWGKPNVLWAMLALIEAAPGLEGDFVRFLKEISPSHLNATIVPILSDKSWAREVLDAWKSKSGTPGPVKKAIETMLKRAD